MVYSCADIVELTSIGATVEGGDIEEIGSRSVTIEQRDLRFADARRPGESTDQ